MKTKIRNIFSLIAIALSLFILYIFYYYYTYFPATRDGKIKGDVISVAADVTGRITDVYTHDNSKVKKEESLIKIDQERFSNSVAQATADLEKAKVNYSSAERDESRYNAVGWTISKQEKDAYSDRLKEAKAELDHAISAKQAAEIDLKNSVIKSSVNGKVSNFSVKPGAYATKGQPIFSIVDTDSIYVVGYFEETKIKNIKIGTAVSVTLMGEPHSYNGVVQSISPGIQDNQLTSYNPSELASVNQSFSWVRLAQRIPVRISITDKVDPDVFIVGRTASITLKDNACFIGKKICFNLR